jgi:hypothetical protein
MEIPKVSGETMAGPPKLNDDWYSGGMELVSQEIYTALRRLGYEPTGRSFAKTDADLRKQSAQWRLRQFDEVPKDMEEVEWALMEALVIQGSCQVWRGDGLCCAAQMVWAQHERAKIAGAEVDRLRTLSQNNAHSWDAIVRERDELRAALKPFAEAADGYELRPGHTNSAHDSWIYDQRRIIVGDLRRAKEALGG